MILFQINTTGLAIGKFKCETPRTVDVNSVARRIEPDQRMKIEPRKVHFLRPGDNSQPVQPYQNTSVEIHQFLISRFPKA